MSQQIESPDDAERRRIAEDIASRLRRDGVSLMGRETGEELGQILEAQERFESAVQRRGGDLVVDEPIHGRAPSAAYLDGQVFDRVEFEYRYADYVADISVMNYGQSGVRVREQYQWAKPYSSARSP